MKVDVTIAILTFNGEEFLEELLNRVFDQKSDLSYEVLVIDSGSSDRTLEILEKFEGKLRLHQIPNKEFGHGRTRNLAASMANGDFIVFITQDAVPAHQSWLNGLIEPFSISDKVACVFGRQIPRPNCCPIVKREVASVFQSLGPDFSIMVQRGGEVIESLNLIPASSFFSDVNSAIKLSVLREIPFQDVKYAEDQAFGGDAIRAGYLKAYSPFGAVYHSHDLPLKQYFKRKFDEAYGLREATGLKQQADLRELIWGSFKATMQDWRFIRRDREYTFRQKVKGYLLAGPYNIALRLAIRRAARDVTPEERSRLSLESQTRKLKEP